MALPRHLQHTFTPQEIEFLTESELVTIYPQYTSRSIDLITEKIPNMLARHRMDVPLWYAITLKKQNKCRIFAPDWLSEDQLKLYLKNEKANPHSFTNLPFNWLELSKIYFTYAADYFPSSEVVSRLKQLIIELKEIRAIKVQSGLTTIDEHYLQLDNLSRMEINEIRTFVTDVMGKYIDLKNTLTPEDQEDDQEVEAIPVEADEDDAYEDNGFQYNYDQ